MYNHHDYVDAAGVCASIRVSDLQAGDVVWAPDPDPFNPWREMVEIVGVGPTGWARVRPVGGHDIRGAEMTRHPGRRRFGAESEAAPPDRRARTRQGLNNAGSCGGHCGRVSNRERLLHP